MQLRPARPAASVSAVHTSGVDTRRYWTISREDGSSGTGAAGLGMQPVFMPVCSCLVLRMRLCALSVARMQWHLLLHAWPAPQHSNNIGQH